VLTDEERKRWVDKDEELYLAWQESGMSKKRWVKENRSLIDDVANNIVDQAGNCQYSRCKDFDLRGGDCE
jgi:hypothetical protein